MRQAMRNKQNGNSVTFITTGNERHTRATIENGMEIKIQTEVKMYVHPKIFHG